MDKQTLLTIRRHLNGAIIVIDKAYEALCTDNTITYNGKELNNLSESELKAFKKKIKRKLNM